MSDNLCEHCTAACCHYVALPIETPEDPSDFDDIRWYLIHQNVTVFVEDEEWFISFHTPCRHLQSDFRCGIYATRPQICRRYTTENCDYHSGDYGWELHFTSPEHLDVYIRDRFPKRGRVSASKGAKRRRTGLRAKPKRRGDFADVPSADADRAGVPLPVLPE